MRFLQCFHRRTIDFNGSRPCRFWAPIVFWLNVDLPSRPIDIVPFKMRHLSLAQPRKYHELDHRSHTLIRSRENRPHLIFREEMRFLDWHLEPLDLREIGEVSELDPELEDTGEDFQFVVYGRRRNLRAAPLIRFHIERRYIARVAHEIQP